MFDGSIFKHDRFAEAARYAVGCPGRGSNQGVWICRTRRFGRCRGRIRRSLPFGELRYALSQMRLSELAVGSDDRNRCLLSPFRARTGRMLRATRSSFLGHLSGCGSLIRPLRESRSPTWTTASRSSGLRPRCRVMGRCRTPIVPGDPYVTFAKQAGALPVEATKATPRADSRPVQARRCWGRSTACTARRSPPGSGTRKAWPRICYVSIGRRTRCSGAGRTEWWTSRCSGIGLHTVFGWWLRVGPMTTDRTLRNFPMQANGAECLRLACVYALRRGVKVIAPVHDALLIEAREDDQIDHAVLDSTGQRCRPRAPRCWADSR